VRTSTRAGWWRVAGGQTLAPSPEKREGGASSLRANLRMHRARRQPQHARLALVHADLRLRVLAGVLHREQEGEGAGGGFVVGARPLREQA
jgi:hypothetical protein